MCIAEVLRRKSSKTTCQTLENIDCALPFIYKNKTYSGCTAVDAHHDIDERLWCSTNTDQSGRHKGEKSWGFCKEKECPIQPILD